MEKLTVRAYLYLLRTEFIETMVNHCEEQLRQHPLVKFVREEVIYVVKCMAHLHELNKTSDRFESEYLRRVIHKFRTDVDIQSLELMILEIILLHALNKYQIGSAKIPAIIKLHRDKPLIRPDAMVRINAAAKLLAILDREQYRPTVLQRPEEIVGRLILHLFFKEHVESLPLALQLIHAAPRLEYINGVVCIELNEPDIQCRYVLSEPGAIWWLHWLSVKDIYPLNSRKTVSYYISAYLRSIDDWQYPSVSVATLKLLRKTDLSLRISPIHYSYITNFFKSQSLSRTAFLRILTDKKVQNDSERSDVSRVMTVREKRSWKRQTLRERYTPVDLQEAELRRMLDLLKPDDDRHKTGRLAVSKKELIRMFTEWLIDNQDTYSPYLWLLMAWIKSLLTDGGQVKASLKPGTIIDYVLSIGPAFLSLFCQYRIDELEPDNWIDLLNELGQNISSAHRKGFVIYLASYLRDSELVPDLAVNELEVAVAHGEVDANLVSPHHIELIMSYLMKQESIVCRDAILLLGLCFFSGLRRNEAAFLQLADFTFAVETNGPVDLYVRPSVRRGLKSTAARRILPLDVLWPDNFLAILRDKVAYRRSQSLRATGTLFEDSKSSEEAFHLITDLLHHVTGDQRLRIHHLRHSFANWQWFRLNPSLLPAARQQLTLFEHPLFSAEQVERLHTRLGLKPVSRKSMFVLCHLLGHNNPITTIASYLHLKDLAAYLLLKARETIKDKHLTQTLGRTKVQLRRDCADNLALRLSFETKRQENMLAPIPYGKDLSPSSPLLHDFVIKAKTDHDVSKRNLLGWASILMACHKLTPEQIAENEGMHPDDIRRLLSTAATIQNACSGRGRKMPLIPNLAPWLARLMREKQEFVAQDEKTQRQSSSLRILRFLLERVQNKLDQKDLTWDVIQKACYNLAYVVPGKGFIVRSPGIKKTQYFLELLHQLGLKANHLRLTLYLDPEKTTNEKIQEWYKALKQSPLGELVFDQGYTGEFDYIKQAYRHTGVLQIALVNRRLSTKGRRQRVYLSFFQLMAILSLYLQ